jgi:hypothetical protein
MSRRQERLRGKNSQLSALVRLAAGAAGRLRKGLSGYHVAGEGLVRIESNPAIAASYGRTVRCACVGDAVLLYLRPVAQVTQLRCRSPSRGEPPPELSVVHAIRGASDVCSFTRHLHLGAGRALVALRTAWSKDTVHLMRCAKSLPLCGRRRCQRAPASALNPSGP